MTVSQPGPQSGRYDRTRRKYVAAQVAVDIAGTVAVGVITFLYTSKSGKTLTVTSFALTIGAALVALMIFLAYDRVLGTFRDDKGYEIAARVRLQAAEQRLTRELGGGHEMALIPSQAKLKDFDEEPKEESLALSALWEVTHSRIDLYHQIATGQARRSFLSAQLAAGIGFILIIFFAILATRTDTESGAITVGSLGGVSAALAGYIGRTFVRSQESAASHLRAYFDQPLEFSRYLAAERLLASATDLDADRRAAILAEVVQAMVAHASRTPGARDKS